jgi:predicted nucleotidyltransferase
MARKAGMTVPRATIAPACAAVKLCAASVAPTISVVKRFVPATTLGQLVAAHRDQRLAAAAMRHASDVCLFGSLARGQDGSESDVDILSVRVDVGTELSLRPEVRADALNDAVLL